MNRVSLFTMAMTAVLATSSALETAEAAVYNLTFVNRTGLPAEVLLIEGKSGTPYDITFKGIVQPNGQLVVKNVFENTPYEFTNTIAKQTGRATQNGTVQLTSTVQGNPHKQVTITVNNQEKYTVTLEFVPGRNVPRKDHIWRGTANSGQSVQRIAKIGELWVLHGPGFSSYFGVSKNEVFNLGQNKPNPPNNPNTPANNTKSALAALIFKKVNDYRTANGRRALQWNNVVAGQVQNHANEMAARYNGQRRLDHEGAPGRADNIAKTIPYRLVGENVAGSGDGTDEAIATTVFEGWKASKEHNTNMLNNNFTFSGIGVTKKGGYVYVSQFFVQPR